MLRDRFKVILQTAWDGRECDAMIALHARRSADSIARFHAQAGAARLAVVLTGTDLYRDLPASLEARRSLDAAGRIVVLHEEALLELDPAWRKKAQLIFQSARPIARAKKPRRPVRFAAVGHLREEKDPRTLFAAVRLLPSDLDVEIRHVGAPLDAALAAEARDLAAHDSRYVYAGALPAHRARAMIARAHALVHPSVMEGGANVIAEAVTSGTPVIASRIAGNVGMLGREYPGYFPVHDASALAARLVQACEEPRFLAGLGRACAARRRLFSPATEAREIRALARVLVSQGRA